MMIPEAIPRHALVTGAGKRIGRGLALALADAGFDVSVHANTSRDDAEQTAGEIRTKGRNAAIVMADLTDRDAVASLMGTATNALGPVGVLVNNASLFQPDSARDVAPDLWDAHFRVHAEAPAFLARDLAAQLPDDAQGVIVNLVDQRVWRLTPQFFSYTLSKSVLWTMTRTLAQALAPDIRVNAIAPGPTLPSIHQSREDFEHEARSIPLQHGPDLNEFGATLIHILSTPSLTGQMIALDGGQHLAWETPDVRGSGE
ncbi:MAG: SDR family oxidoreductase [Pseudomonadota bacterium]